MIFFSVKQIYNIKIDKSLNVLNLYFMEMSWSYEILQY